MRFESKLNFKQTHNFYNFYLMKKSLIAFMFIIMSLSAQGLEINVEANCFKNEEKSYLETYIRVIGETINFEFVEGSRDLVYAGVELTMIISKGEEVIAFERYVLNSPHFEHPTDFLDVKRFALPAGTYALTIDAKDVNNEENTLEIKKRVVVEAFDAEINLSDVQLLASVEAADPTNPLAKNGLVMEPLTYGFIGADIDVLNIYCEVYRSEGFMVTSFVKYAIVEGYADGGGDVAIRKFKKLAGKTTEPLLLKLPVNELPSGKYHVEVELFDKQKNPLAKTKVDFIRSNPVFDKEYWQNYNADEGHSFVSDMSAEELDYSLRAISAIVYEPKKSLMNYIIKEAPIRAQRKFLLDFWKDKAPISPEMAYHNFMTVAKAIDIEFDSNVGYGFETDRGYIFLRYGKPNNIISIDTEPDSFPYEIWYYDFLKETNQLNVRFIFYNRSLAHNDYLLLHSTCLGELQNPLWELELYKRGLDVREQNIIQDRSIQDNWQRNARRFFNEY